jgi:hypothetical protein
MTEQPKHSSPPLKICINCRGDGCPDCSDRGVGVPLTWLMEHAYEYEIVTDSDGRRYAREREKPEPLPM